MLDVVTFGEAMIRLTAPPGEALESAPHFSVHVGGAEANVAVTLARLGFRAGWVSKLVPDPLGRRVAGELRRHGVDVSAVVWASQGRTGLYFVEHAPPPRGMTISYDRAGSACSTTTPDDIDWAYVRGAQWVHLTGITPALSDPCARTVARMIAEARDAGRRVAFDVNHRRKLWTADRARATLEPLIEGVNLLIITQDDAREVFALNGEAPDLAAAIVRRWRTDAAVVTAGAAGAYLARGSDVHHEPAVAAGEIDRIGRGDAFAAGLLWGALEGDLLAGMRYGAALAALAQTYWGDVSWSTKEDVLAVLDGGRRRPAR
ncbi:MAG: sugar kinase [Armatimonadetes bacterium]|nr:sugar kinase [Armatimonadota bacterium]